MIYWLYTHAYNRRSDNNYIGDMCTSVIQLMIQQGVYEHFGITDGNSQLEDRKKIYIIIGCSVGGAMIAAGIGIFIYFKYGPGSKKHQ